jgi:ferric-dicitrate binding protein FerR (iron transport regulator)
MEMTDELMERFFKGLCSEEEREAIDRYIQENPLAWEQYLARQDWQTIDYKQKLHPALSGKMLNKVRNATYRKAGVVRTLKRLAVAAIVLLAIGVGWRYLLVNTKDNIKIEELSSIAKVEPYRVQRRLNTTNKPLLIALEEGSAITLSPGSRVEYTTPLVKEHKRTIYLTGEAYFAVAKDSAAPFTVYSDGISTTALGTSFTIKAMEKEPFISVHLHTGKVVVKSVDSVRRKMHHNIYLTPTQIMVYDKEKMLATVRTESSHLVKADNKTVVPNWYMFSNQPLVQVFEQLEELYGVKINYTKADLKDMYFIGRFDKTDSLEHIINDIAILNKLTVTRKGNIYTLTKKDH